MPDIIRKAFTPGEFKLDEAGAVKVAFAQLNVIDRDGDLTLPGAFTPKSVPMSGYGHTSWDGALPVGKGDIAEVSGSAVFEGKFLMETDQGRNAYHTVKAMADLQEWSYGYNPTDYSYETRDGQTIRLLKGLDVYEVSPVLLGAGIGTHTLAIKSGGRPAADAPYGDLLSWYSEGLPDLLDRVKSRADFRAKEGRGLSNANRVQLVELASALEGHVKAVRDLLADAERPVKAAEQRRVEIDLLLSTARQLGVTA